MSAKGSTVSRRTAVLISFDVRCTYHVMGHIDAVEVLLNALEEMGLVKYGWW